MAALLAGSILAPWTAAAAMPVTVDLLPEEIIEAIQFRSNNQSGGFGGGSMSRSQISRPSASRPPINVPEGRPPVPRPPPIGRPPGGRPPMGMPPRRPGGGWGGPVFVPEYYPRPRPPVVVDDDYEEYVPRPQRRPRPVRRPVIVEVEDDEPVARQVAPRRQPRRPPVAARQPAPKAPVVRAPVTPPPVQAARRPPRLPPVLVPLATERRLVRDEILVELKDGVTADVVSRRHGLTALSTERLTLASVTIVRYRIEGNRTARQALAAMSGDVRIASAQPNFIYTLQQDRKPEDQPPLTTGTETAPAAPQIEVQPVVALPAPDVVPALAPIPAPAELSLPAAPPVERKAQYILGKMGIDVAHRISRGNRVRVAVIDTGVDDAHPELEGTVTQRFDAITDVPVDGTNHGTAMAGAIIAKASLQGVSPAAELLVARAFTGTAVTPGSGAEGTTMHILKSLDWAHAQGARVVNLSFAGPQDRLMSRALLGGSTKGMIAVAAAGNGGPKAQPAFPGADPSVIAVTATDADDRIFAQANNGGYVAVAAPGVDVIAAEPGKRYGFSSGTSIAAAHVSGLVALMLEQKADLDLAGVRAILSETALDLGKKGHDSVFGAGRIDAPAALARTIKTGAVPKP
ncbi:MAG: S8 family serine peptidase [Beijerinckiaceae bacterium]